jgi:glyoxylase-like metal-dependent hydrolase (beta-lactamase superfamily II)
MITIASFTFNPFQENTYILSDETGECVIIDPGCYEESEKEELRRFIELKKLKPVKSPADACSHRSHPRK